MPAKVTAENTINGAFGELIIGATVLANVMSVEATVAVSRQEMRLGGSRQTHYKVTNVQGSGSFTIYRVTSEFMDMALDAMNLRNNLKKLGNGRPGDAGLKMVVSLKDPEIVGGDTEQVELSGVKIWNIPFGFSVDDIVQQTIEFTFESMAMSKTIDGIPNTV